MRVVTDIMTIYYLLVQLLYVLIWTVLLAGSAIFLRRGYAGGAVSALLGAAIALLGALLHLLMTVSVMLGHAKVFASQRVVIALGIPSLAGILLFALGFLQLARTTKRED